MQKDAGRYILQGWIPELLEYRSCKNGITPMVYQKDRIDSLCHAREDNSPVVTWMVVCGNSMKPFFRAGQMVAVRPVPTEAIKKGSVILYSYGDADAEETTSVIHRVIDMVHDGGRRCFLCHGDNNLRPDDPIDQDVVIGKVVGLYYHRKFKPLRRYHELGGLILSKGYRWGKSMGKKGVVAAWPLLSRWLVRTVTVEDQRGQERKLVFMRWGNTRLPYDFSRVAARAYARKK